jgi:hypothetical protein
MPQMESKYSAEELARRGREIFENEIREQVESESQGRVVAIDVVSHEFAVGDNILAAAAALRLRKPDAQVWLVRVNGYVL